MSLLSTPQTGRWRDHSDGHRKYMTGLNNHVLMRR
jgi:hypothetical protein